MNGNRQTQSELSDVPRRHGVPAESILLIASQDVQAYRAIEPFGNRQGRLSFSGYPIGISRKAVTIGQQIAVASIGQTVTNPTWAWTAGIVNTTTAGVLTQAAGTRIGVALSPTEVLVTL